MVVVGHSHGLGGHPVPTLLGERVDILGVKLFFLLSGYLITASWQRDPNFLRFAEKRARRIMPALLTVVAFTGLLLGPILTTNPSYFSEPETWRYLWRNALLLPYYGLPGVFKGNLFDSVNGSLWSLPVEVAMYVLAPLLIRAGPWACAAAALALIVMPASAEFGTFSLAGASSVVPFFLIGSALQLSKVTMPAFRLPVLRVDMSYGIYLVSYPIQQALLTLRPDISPLALAATTLIIAVPLAWFLWTFVEKPSMRSKTRLEKNTVTATIA